MKYFQIRYSILCLLAILFLTDCGSQQTRNQSPDFRFVPGAGREAYASADPEKNPGPVNSRIILYNATLRMIVKTPDTVVSRLKAIAGKYEGYVQTLGSRECIIRVKADQLQNAVADISRLGKVRSRVISGNDVTEEYVNYQIRLENADKARKRYLELLARAENVQAALLVEKELERLNGDIDLLQGKMNRLKHLSEYCTITVYLEEKIKPGLLGYLGIAIYRSVRWLIVRN